MKNASRISARRVLQGSAAFAALGALTLVAASPAHADSYGWAYASALGGDDGAAETYITQDQTVSNSFSDSIGSWLTVEGTTTATVDSNGATGTAVVDTARIVITEADLPGILDPGTDDEDDEDDEKDDETEDETGEEGEGDTGDGELPQDGAPGDSDPADEGETGGPGDGGAVEPGAPSDAPTDTPTEEPTEEPAGPAEEGEDKDTDTASAEVIDLDDDSAELVDNGGDILLEATISGASVSTSQSWAGKVGHDFNQGSLDDSNVRALVDDEEIELLVSLESATAVFESEDAGFVWNDAVTDMYLTFSVGGEIVAGYPIAESAAGITTGAVDGGGDNGGDDGGDSDGKNPPQKERDKDTLLTTDAKDTEPLARTGSPLVGLIAAGAAIAAGGGAAAYLARRRKNNEEGAETDES